MKLSKFNIIKYINEDTLIYNTISAGVLMLNKEYSKYFKDLQNIGTSDKEDLIEQLKQGNMVVDDDIDEVSMLEVANYSQRFSNSHLSLTIAPTLNCNFACPYCYEEGYRYSSMNSDVKNDLIKFIENYKNINQLNITWYGGEPLLEINVIEELTKKILKKFDTSKYSASIVTNGFLLNKENALILKNNHVKSVQVTLDGPKEIHDSRRILLSGAGTFDTILRNIKESCEIIPIVVRINVDKSNINKVDSLIDCFESNNLINKIGFYLAPVDDINSSCKNNQCFSMKEFSDEEVMFYEKCFKKGINSINIPRANLGICGAVTRNSYVVAPTGDLYKCWDEIGRSEYKIGSLKDGYTVNNRLSKWLLYNPLNEHSECRDCSVLPICFGGCPYNYMQGRNKKCDSINYNSLKKMELLYTSKGNKND
ncbi:SPASM domain-containing protein [Clostridium botulinum]|nr:SPASM domain-containing protein [Clostridium botulinum]